MAGGFYNYQARFVHSKTAATTVRFHLTLRCTEVAGPCGESWLVRERPRRFHDDGSTKKFFMGREGAVLISNACQTANLPDHDQSIER